MFSLKLNSFSAFKSNFDYIFTIAFLVYGLFRKKKLKNRTSAFTKGFYFPLELPPCPERLHRVSVPRAGSVRAGQSALQPLGWAAALNLPLGHLLPSTEVL